MTRGIYDLTFLYDKTKKRIKKSKEEKFPSCFKGKKRVVGQIPVFWQYYKLSKHRKAVNKTLRSEFEIITLLRQIIS